MGAPEFLYAAGFGAAEVQALPVLDARHQFYAQEVGQPKDGGVLPVGVRVDGVGLQPSSSGAENASRRFWSVSRSNASRSEGVMSCSGGGSSAVAYFLYGIGAINAILVDCCTITSARPSRQIS